MKFTSKFFELVVTSDIQVLALRHRKTNSFNSITPLIFTLHVFTGVKGGHGSAGSALGPRYGNGGMKGPMQGSITASLKWPFCSFLVSVG